jgi:hypothetical protein
MSSAPLFRRRGSEKEVVMATTRQPVAFPAMTPFRESSMISSSGAEAYNNFVKITIATGRIMCQRHLRSSSVETL